jgi:hypothetical protein
MLSVLEGLAKCGDAAVTSPPTPKKTPVLLMVSCIQVWIINKNRANN